MQGAARSHNPQGCEKWSVHTTHFHERGSRQQRRLQVGQRANAHTDHDHASTLSTFPGIQSSGPTNDFLIIELERVNWAALWC